MAKEVVKLKTIYNSKLAGALDWLGFPYIKVITENGQIAFIFERVGQFDTALKDLQVMKNLYRGE